MTFRALQPDTEKQLADHRRHLVGAPPIPIQRRGTIVPGASLSGHQFADELVVGHIVAKLLTNPIVVVQHRLDTDAIGVGP